ncbi:MAG: hypothetical protein CL676_11345 [Bdellovibrionaceae bacterium]|nr:hypothetical protein [Pseudobdellovibrionaceae bacterium]|tara:strand:+ start:4130 stop:4414 length:285 start_codon:yes stop_codon:yes gene_type:complete
MVLDNCQDNKSEKTDSNQNVRHEMCDSDLLFEKLEWLNSKEAALFLRKSIGALRVMVHRGQIRARKFHRRLYFKKCELNELLETSQLTGGLQCR